RKVITAPALNSRSPIRCRTPTRFPRWVHRRLPPPPLRCARKALRSGGGALLWTTWKILAGVAERDRSGGSPAKNYGFSPASTCERLGIGVRQFKRLVRSWKQHGDA